MALKRTDWEHTWTSAAQSIYAVLQYTDKKGMYTLADVMFFSGNAFRINIHPGSVSPAGPTMFSPTELIERGLRILGFTVEQLHGFHTPAPPEKLRYAIEFAQETIDRGIPAIGWSLFLPEFGIIYGYDDEKHELYCRDPEKDGTLPYHKLNELPMNFVCMLRVRDSVKVDRVSMWKKALEMIIEFAEGRAPALSDEYKHGLAGYDAWIEAFKNRVADPFGNAYNAAVVSCAREYAAKFFEEMPVKWTGEDELDREMAALAPEAAFHYKRTAESLRELSGMFPFPQGGEPRDPGLADRAVELLAAAKEAEEQGVTVLRRMYDAIVRSETSSLAKAGDA